MKWQYRFSGPDHLSTSSAALVADAWDAPWHLLSSVELIPGCSVKRDVWRIPLEWRGKGIRKQDSQATIDFRNVVPEGGHLVSARVQFAIRTAKRMAILMNLRTLRMGSLIVPPTAPSTWVSHVQHLVRATHWVLSHTQDKSVQAEGPIFSDLTPTQMQELLAANPLFAAFVVGRLNALLAAEAFDDWPATDVSVIRLLSTPLQPLPDDFVASVGHAALWMTETLGPDLLSCWETVRATTTTPSGSSKRGDVMRHRRGVVARWEGLDLTKGFQFRYGLLVRGKGDSGFTSSDPLWSWPPDNGYGVRDAVFLLQAAHAVVLSLCTAARDSETVELARDCIVQRTEQSLLGGHTFKLADQLDGEHRHWALPKVAVTAIRQQQRLADIMDPTGSRLFVPFDARAEGDLKGVGYLFFAFANRVLSRDGRPLSALCDDRLGSTRIRKTVVRLAALALVGANQTLVDVLGHRDPEMTLGYILSDPGIQDDMRTVAREASIAIGREAVAGAEQNGGPAAKDVREMTRRFTPRQASADLEADGLNLAAEILTLNGSVMLVRKGVLCTKTFNQFGPCTRRAGAPDAGNCQPDCAHRLELAAARADHKAAIRQILEEAPTEPGLMRSWWQAQLVAHLIPFPDLAAEMTQDARVSTMLEGVDPATLAKLGFGQTISANLKLLP